MKKVALVFFTLSLCLFLTFNSFSNNNKRIVDINVGYNYSSDDLYQRAFKLVEKYGDILELEVLDYSYDNKPIYVIRLTENVKEYMKTEDANVNRMHFFVEAGIHSREIVNPVVILTLIEDYCQAYYKDGIIEGYNLHDLLSKTVVHFMPVTVPDGMDLAKFGSKSIKNRMIRSKFIKNNYNQIKENLRGVDINYNFPAEYYNVKTKTWINLWESLVSGDKSTGYINTRGEHGGSEIETKILMDYVLKYDFRNYLSYHSRGEVIYYGKQRIESESFKTHALELAGVAGKTTGYKVIPPEENRMFGYLSCFVSYNTLKPIITLETTPITATFPANRSLYNPAYQETRLVPLAFVQNGIDRGYYNYRLYVDGIYQRDFEDLIFAKAIEEKTGGYLIEEVGQPRHRLYFETVISSGENIYNLDTDIVFIEKKKHISLNKVLESIGYDIKYIKEEEKLVATKGNSTIKVEQFLIKVDEKKYLVKDFITYGDDDLYINIDGLKIIFDFDLRMKTD